MVEHIKRWAVPIAVVAMLWIAWAGLRHDTEKKADREPLPEVLLADMPLRAATEAVVRLGDPCKLSAPLVRTAVASSKPPAVAAEVPHVLTLDSILIAPGGAQALISGQTVPVGGAIAGVDAENPPTLAWVDGVRVGIRYRNREYVLDLDRERRTVLDKSHATGAQPVEADSPKSDAENGVEKSEGTKSGGQKASGQKTGPPISHAPTSGASASGASAGGAGEKKP
jgi:hypothetical protein